MWFLIFLLKNYWNFSAIGWLLKYCGVLGGDTDVFVWSFLGSIIYNTVFFFDFVCD
jgi:hypothetical protein